ncbi:MAG: tetratricopeptide repeat protein [bacterium]|nr:tetratricopeptide repeat protein [bacterium]
MLKNKYTFALLTSSIFLLALKPIEAFDTLWQLQSGKYIWETGNFLYKDTFSLAKDSFRLEHCWLHDLILYMLYSIGGFNLLSILKPTLIALSAIILYLWNIRRGGEPPFVLLLIIVCVIGSEQSWLVRPQLWTVIFAMLQICILHEGREKGLKAWILLVPLMLLWANLHAGCVFGIVLTGLFVVAELIRAYQKKISLIAIKPLLLAGLLSFLAAFINPYGYRIPLSTLMERLTQHDTLTGDAPLAWMGNMEVLPPTFDQVPLFYIIMALWAVLIILRWRKLDPAEGVFFLAFTYMGFSQIRHTTLVAVLAGLYVPIAFQDIVKPYVLKMKRELAVTKALYFTSFSFLLVYIGLSAAWGQMGVGLKKDFYPEKAASFILENRLPETMYNSFDWGGYLMWRLYPEYLVFTDGRGGSIERLEMSMRLDNGMYNLDEIMDKYNINTVITNTCFYHTGGPMGSIDQLVNNNNWALIYKDEVAVIFIRKKEEFRHIWDRYQVPSVLAYETMIAEANRLKKERFSPPKVLYALGKANMSLGRYKESLKNYQEYLSENPDNMQVKNIVKILGNYVK